MVNLDRRVADVEGRLQDQEQTMARVHEALDAVLEEFRVAHATHSEEITALRGDVRETRSEIMRRFEQVDRRFEQVDRRFEQVDTRFAQIDARFVQIDARFVQMDGRFIWLVGLQFAVLLGVISTLLAAVYP